jgi:hypothetical protein
MGLAERMVLKRLGIKNLQETVLPVKQVEFTMDNGDKHIVIPIKVSNYEGENRSGSFIGSKSQFMRSINILVKEWYENGEQPDAGKV